MGKGQEKKVPYPKSHLVAKRSVFCNLAEEVTRRKLFCVSGTMWNSQIRKTVANLSIKAGNMIHLFPFMQTQVCKGLCENWYSSAEPQRHRNKVLLLDILAFLSFFLFFFSLFYFLWILWLITQQVQGVHCQKTFGMSS